MEHSAVHLWVSASPMIENNGDVLLLQTSYSLLQLKLAVKSLVKMENDTSRGRPRVDEKMRRKATLPMNGSYTMVKTNINIY